jgi:hypothetical protein
MPVAAKAVIHVMGGILPHYPIPEHSKSWHYTSTDFEADQLIPKDQPTKFSTMLDEAHEYAKGLSNPAYLNWVKVEWMWI